MNLQEKQAYVKEKLHLLPEEEAIEALIAEYFPENE